VTLLLARLFPVWDALSTFRPRLSFNGKVIA
jgi:hypothetical protein